MNDVLDLDALRHLRAVIGGNTDDLMELVEEFVATLPRQIEDMRVQSKNGDLTALRITAHSCKSNARDLGAPVLSSLCAELEKACAAGQATRVEPLVKEIGQAAQAALDGYARLEPTDV
jgi:HPt (histidine-containing phosphotransfer) domain-containing protein